MSWATVGPPRLEMGPWAAHTFIDFQRKTAKKKKKNTQPEIYHNIKFNDDRLYRPVDPPSIYIRPIDLPNANIMQSLPRAPLLSLCTLGTIQQACMGVFLERMRLSSSKRNGDEQKSSRTYLCPERSRPAAVRQRVEEPLCGPPPLVGGKPLCEDGDVVPSSFPTVNVSSY